MQLVLARVFTELQLHRLEANIQPGNTASIELVTRAGFVHEGFAERYLKISGRWRDHEHWAIRAEQWREREPAASLIADLRRGPRIRSTSSPAPAGSNGSPVISRR